MFRKLFPQAKVRGIYGPVRPSTDVEFIIEKNSNKPVLKEVKFDVPVYMGDNIFQQFNKNLNKLNIVPTWTTTAIPLTSTNNNKNYS